jgi:type II secretory pathway component GspD/PulD (secretin)
MLRVLLAALVLVAQAPPPDMPVTRLSGGALGGTGSQPPAPPRQPAPGQLPPLPVTQIDSKLTTLDSSTRLSLTFAEPRPIDEVLALLVAGTPFSLSIDPDATGSFRGELKNLTLREAFTTVLAPLGLEFRVQGTVLRVVRHQSETRLFDLNLLNVQRGSHRLTGDGNASISTVAPADDVFSGIAEGVQSLLSPAGKVHVDRRSGLAQVSDFAERLERVAIYIDALHQRSGRQVRLQAQVFEVVLKDGPSIDWRLVRDKLGLPRGAPDAGLAADPVALRTALEAQGDVRPLWAPDVTTLNNEPAMVRIATPGGTSLTMTVVPQISADGIVQLSISHAWEEHAGERSQGFLKSSTPFTRVTEADTVTRVMDGNTAMIAGLMRPEQVTVATGARQSIFGSQTRKKPGHAELVVLLRPTVVTPGTFSAGGQ